MINYHSIVYHELHILILFLYFICRTNKDIDKNIVHDLKVMIDTNNVHAKVFRKPRDMINGGQYQDVKLKLISDRKTDGRIYNKPTVSEVAALIVGDIDSASYRDIIMQEQNGQLQRIDEFHASYLSYQYPLIFPYGEDGYRPGILLRYLGHNIITKKTRLTIKGWLSF